jgi:hypothetical protein
MTDAETSTLFREALYLPSDRPDFGLRSVCWWSIPLDVSSHLPAGAV